MRPLLHQKAQLKMGILLVGSCLDYVDFMAGVSFPQAIGIWYGF
jgi:hypothetical protein